METFSALLAICAGNSPVTVELPSQKPVTRSFDVLFDLVNNREAGDLRRHRAHYDVKISQYRAGFVPRKSTNQIKEKHPDLISLYVFLKLESNWVIHNTKSIEHLMFHR